MVAADRSMELDGLDMSSTRFSNKDLIFLVRITEIE